MASMASIINQAKRAHYRRYEDRDANESERRRLMIAAILGGVQQAGNLALSISNTMMAGERLDMQRTRFGQQQAELTSQKEAEAEVTNIRNALMEASPDSIGSSYDILDKARVRQPDKMRANPHFSKALDVMYQQERARFSPQAQLSEARLSEFQAGKAAEQGLTGLRNALMEADPQSLEEGMAVVDDYWKGPGAALASNPQFSRGVRGLRQDIRSRFGTQAKITEGRFGEFQEQQEAQREVAKIRSAVASLRPRGLTTALDVVNKMRSETSEDMQLNPYFGAGVATLEQEIRSQLGPQAELAKGRLADYQTQQAAEKEITRIRASLLNLKPKDLKTATAQIEALRKSQSDEMKLNPYFNAAISSLYQDQRDRFGPRAEAADVTAQAKIDVFNRQRSAKGIAAGAVTMAAVLDADARNQQVPYSSLDNAVEAYRTSTLRPEYSEAFDPSFDDNKLLGVSRNVFLGMVGRDSKGNYRNTELGNRLELLATQRLMASGLERKDISAATAADLLRKPGGPVENGLIGMFFDKDGKFDKERYDKNANLLFAHAARGRPGDFPAAKSQNELAESLVSAAVDHSGSEMTVNNVPISQGVEKLRGMVGGVENMLREVSPEAADWVGQAKQRLSGRMHMQPPAVAKRKYGFVNI